MRNSLDAVADRDFALDYLYAGAVLFVHLSRIGEELCSGRRPSSASPGSRGGGDGLVDDAAEAEPRRRRATRGKAGTAIGRLTGLLATVKGLPLAYNRDLQEDKPPVFAARRDVPARSPRCASSSPGSSSTASVAAAAADPLLLATDAAEALVREGVPFRDAHEQVAAEVRAGTSPLPTRRCCPPRGPGGVREALAAARRRFAPSS